MVPQSRPLIEVLAEMPDFRSNHGKRHPLAAILALACSAMLCGYRSYTAIAEWERHYGEDLGGRLALPIVRPVPPHSIPSCAGWIGSASQPTWGRGLIRGGRADGDGLPEA